LRNKSVDTIISVLADTLVGNDIDSNAISASLKLICDSFSFCCGFVYEIDQYNFLNLKEVYNTDGYGLREGFSIAELKPMYRERLMTTPVSYIRRRSADDPFSLELLNFFFASSLVLVPLSDNEDRLSGLIGLMGADDNKTLSSSQLKTVTKGLHMLGKYIGLRILHTKLEHARTSLESIMDNTGIDIYVNDFYNHDILYANKSMAAPYGGIAHFIGKKCWEALYPGQKGPCTFCPQPKLIDEYGNPTKLYSWDYQRLRDGSWFRVFSAPFRWIDGRLAHVVSSVDITESKHNEETIKRMANYDLLTGLPNRRKLVDDCEHKISNAEENYNGFVLFFDLDGFKVINDTLGHESGDEFLMMLGRFFTGIPAIKNSIYRHGGDEFVALLNGNDITKHGVREIVHSIHDRFMEPWHLKKGDIFCNTSVGVARYPEDGRAAEELLHHADQAMYHVKKSGGGGICFAHELNDITKE